jgi:hypothetical protein
MVSSRSAVAGFVSWFWIVIEWVKLRVGVRANGRGSGASSGGSHMVGTLLLCVALMAAERDNVGRPGAGASADRSAYESASKEAGRDAKAHVRLALWCEGQGLSGERMKHLALAVLYDPTNTLARGLMGLVA